MNRNVKFTWFFAFKKTKKSRRKISKTRSGVSQAVSSWKNGCNYEHLASLRTNFLAIESGSDLSSLACTSSEESKRDEDSCESNFSENLFYDYLTSENDISSFYAIIISHFEKLCHGNNVSVVFLPKILQYSSRDF